MCLLTIQKLLLFELVPLAVELVAVLSQIAGQLGARLIDARLNNRLRLVDVIKPVELGLIAILGARFPVGRIMPGQFLVPWV